MQQQIANTQTLLDLFATAVLWTHSSIHQTHSSIISNIHSNIHQTHSSIISNIHSRIHQTHSSIISNIHSSIHHTHSSIISNLHSSIHHTHSSIILNFHSSNHQTHPGTRFHSFLFQSAPCMPPPTDPATSACLEAGLSSRGRCWCCLLIPEQQSRHEQKGSPGREAQPCSLKMCGWVAVLDALAAAGAAAAAAAGN